MADLSNPMANPNPGSFMAPAGGGGSSISQAMARRGMLPATAQVGGGAPGAAAMPSLPSVPAGMQSPMPVPPPQPGGAPVGPDGETPPTAGTPPIQAPGGNPEAQMIVKALDGRLKSISKVEEGPNFGA